MLLLGSKSPRRSQILADAGFEFRKVEMECSEDIEGVAAELVAEHLAIKKNAAYDANLNNDILLTADTTVVFNDTIFNKPQNREEAIEMLEVLSNTNHNVITGVCIRSSALVYSFNVKTKVFFKSLSKVDIHYYVDTFKPYDKAGAYGIQEWIGDERLEKIEGSFSNVVGLPQQETHEALRKYFNYLPTTP